MSIDRNDVTFYPESPSAKGMRASDGLPKVPAEALTRLKVSRTDSHDGPLPMPVRRVRGPAESPAAKRR